MPPQRINTKDLRSSIIDDISPFYPLPTPSVRCPPLPTSASITRSTFSDFLEVKMMGPMTRYAYYSFRFIPHFFNTSFEGACSQLNRITDMNTMSIVSSVARNPMLLNFLPLVHLVGSILQHFLIA